MSEGDLAGIRGPSSSHLRELSRSACEQLLSQHVVGRVGFCSAGGPVILPVNYRLYNEQVVLRTSPYGLISELRRRTPVAFEVDDIDERAETGWDVLGRGFAEAVTGDHPLNQLWRTVPAPWAAGTRSLFIAITLTSLSGRIVRAHPAD